MCVCVCVCVCVRVIHLYMDRNPYVFTFQHYHLLCPFWGQGFDERGERLGEIEENAARMRDNASDFELLAAKLAKKHHKY